MSGALGFTRVLHVAINSAADPHGVRSWWGDLLGEPSPRPPIEGVDGQWLGSAQVHLVETAGTGPLGPHWCLGVRSLPEARSALDARGISYVTGVQVWPDGTAVDQLWFTDPTGATVELQQDPEAQASGT
jgi:hypothetical protein